MCSHRPSIGAADASAIPSQWQRVLEESATTEDERSAVGASIQPGLSDVYARRPPNEVRVIEHQRDRLLAPVSRQGSSCTE